jgi:hypothetical protein
LPSVPDAFLNLKDFWVSSRKEPGYGLILYIAYETHTKALFCVRHHSSSRDTCDEYQEIEYFNCGYEIFIAAISVLSVVDMLLALVLGVDPDAMKVISLINTALTLFLLADFLARFFVAPLRGHFISSAISDGQISLHVPLISESSGYSVSLKHTVR